MNNKILATTMFLSIALGAYSAPIYTILDLNSSVLIQNDSSKDSLESVGEKLLALNIPKGKSKKSKKEVEEEEIEDEDDESFDDEEVDSDSENEGDDSDDDDENIDSDDDSDGDDDDEDVDSDDDTVSNGGGFGDIKSKLEDKNSTLPESKTEYHIHKNAPARTVTNKLDPQGLMTEYITYFYGDEIEMKHTVSFLANGSVNVNGNIKANFQTNTPAKSWSNSRNVNGQTIMDFYYYNGKIKATFTLTPLRNGTTNIGYNCNVLDPNI